MSRQTTPGPAIIHAPSAQAPGSRTLYGLATLVVWAVYAWLWLPLATLLLWVLGVRLGFMELYLAQQKIDPMLLVWLPALLLACACVLIGWAEYNRWRFAGRDRRNGRGDVTRDEVATAMHAPPELAAALAAAGSAVLVMGTDGRPLAMRPGPAGRPDGMRAGDTGPGEPLAVADAEALPA